MIKTYPIPEPQPHPKFGGFIDLTDEIFGRLTVRYYGGHRNGRTQWVVDCICGNRKIVAATGLRKGGVTSCGCLYRERLGNRYRTHGESTSRGVYSIWASMRDRCNNPKNKAFPHYGGRGIKVCERWNDYEAFKSDMGDRPAGMSINRINNDGDYCPENCKWATTAEQANNKRSNRLLTYEGKTQTVMQWARELSINHDAVYGRLRNGATDAEALFGYDHAVKAQAEIKRLKGE